MAQGQTVLAELALERGPCGARLDPGREGDRVDLENAVEPAQVEGDHRLILAESRLDAADHTGASAEGDHGRPLLLAPGEHQLDLGLVRGEGDQVGRVGKLASEAADDVAVGLAQPVRDALVAPVAEQARERPGRLQPRAAELDLLQPDRLRDRGAAEAEALRGRGGGRLQLRPRGPLVLIPPPPVLEPSLGPYQCTPFIRWAKATCSVDASFSISFAPFSPFAAFESGKSL